VRICWTPGQSSKLGCA